MSILPFLFFLFVNLFHVLEFCFFSFWIHLLIFHFKFANFEFFDLLAIIFLNNVLKFVYFFHFSFLIYDFHYFFLQFFHLKINFLFSIFQNLLNVILLQINLLNLTFFNIYQNSFLILSIQLFLLKFTSNINFLIKLILQFILL